MERSVKTVKPRVQQERYECEVEGTPRIEAYMIQSTRASPAAASQSARKRQFLSIQLASLHSFFYAWIVTSGSSVWFVDISFFFIYIFFLLSCVLLPQQCFPGDSGRKKRNQEVAFLDLEIRKKWLCNCFKVAEGKRGWLDARSTRPYMQVFSVPLDDWFIGPEALSP